MLKFSQVYPSTQNVYLLFSILNSLFLVMVGLLSIVINVVISKYRLNLTHIVDFSIGNCHKCCYFQIQAQSDPYSRFINSHKCCYCQIQAQSDPNLVSIELRAIISLTFIYLTLELSFLIPLQLLFLYFMDHI